MTVDLLVNLAAALIAFSAGLATRAVAARITRALKARRERIRTAQRRPEYAVGWIVDYYRSRGHESDLFKITADDVERRIPFLVRPRWYTGNVDEGQLLRQSLPHRKSQAPNNGRILARRSQYLTGLDDGEIWNDLHACAFRIEDTATGPQIVVGVCEYLQYMSTCGSLEDETYAAVRKKRARTPIRDKVLPDAHTAMDCALGANSIGMTVAIVFGDYGVGAGPKVLIQRRSQAVSTYGGGLGVVPMFSCQTTDLTDRTLVSLEHNFLREVYEELYNGQEVQRKTPRVDPAWFLQDPVMDPVLRYIADADSRLQLLGFGFDALNGQLIIGGLMNLGSSEFAPEELGQMSGNWEVNNIEVWALFGDPLTEALLAGYFTPGCAFTLARSRERIRSQSASQ